MDCTAYVMKTEGLRGFFRGLIPTYVKVIPAIAITFGINERLKAWLQIY